MLSTRLEQWEEAIFEKGFAKGFALGFEKGIKRGESNLIYRQLDRRFSPLPSRVQEKLSTADGPTLERWALNLLEAETLEDVFK